MIHPIPDISFVLKERSLIERWCCSFSLMLLKIQIADYWTKGSKIFFLESKMTDSIIPYDEFMSNWFSQLKSFFGFLMWNLHLNQAFKILTLLHKQLSKKPQRNNDNKTTHFICTQDKDAALDNTVDNST